MKINYKHYIWVSLVMFPGVALSQEVAVNPVDPAVQEVAVEEFLKFLIQSLGGIKGAGALAIVGIVIQVLMVFFKTKLAAFAGKYKLLVVYGLSLVAGIIGLKIAGVDFVTALIHSNTLAAAQVFGHQVFLQFFKKAPA